MCFVKKAADNAHIASTAKSAVRMAQKTTSDDQQQYIEILNKAANPDACKDISKGKLIEALNNISLSGSDISAEKAALLNFSESSCAKCELQRKAVHDLGVIGGQDVATYLLTLLTSPTDFYAPTDYALEEAVLNALRDIGSTGKIETVKGHLIQTLAGIIEANPQGGLPPSVKRAARYALLAVLRENANYAADRDFRERLEIHALGFYILIVGGFFALIGFLTYISYWAATPFLRDFIYIACAGGLGGTVACGRAYYRYKGDTINKFSLDWSWWYLMRPLIGVVAGLIAYLLLAAGVVTFGPSANATAQGTLVGPLPIQSIALFIVVSFLAGHYFAWFDNKIRDIFKSLFGDTSKEDLGGEKK